MTQKKRGRGRPTKYKQIYSKKIIEYFSQPPTRQVLKKEIIKSNGTIEREYVERAAPLPTFSGFSRHIGVNGDTIVEWSNARDKKKKLKYPDFSAAYNIAKDLQRDFLVHNGLSGNSPPAAFIFVAKNITDMHDKQEVDHTTKGEKITGFNYLSPEKADDEHSPNDSTNA